MFISSNFEVLRVRISDENMKVKINVQIETSVDNYRRLIGIFQNAVYRLSTRSPRK